MLMKKIKTWAVVGGGGWWWVVVGGGMVYKSPLKAQK